MDTVSRHAGTTILTIAGWVLWCLFSRRNSFVPPIEVIAVFIGALAIDILRNAGSSEQARESRIRSEISRAADARPFRA